LGKGKGEREGEEKWRKGRNIGQTITEMSPESIDKPTVVAPDKRRA